MVKVRPLGMNYLKGMGGKTGGGGDRGSLDEREDHGKRTEQSSQKRYSIHVNSWGIRRRTATFSSRNTYAKYLAARLGEEVYA